MNPVKRHDVGRLLAIFANGIGDHIISLPALRALQYVFGRQLELACLSVAADLFFSEIGFGRLHVISGRLFDGEELAARVGPVDCVISFERTASPGTESLVSDLRPRLTVGHSQSCHIFVPTSGVSSRDAAFAIPLAFDPSLRSDTFSYPFVDGQSTARFKKAAAAKLGREPRILAVHCDTGVGKSWSSSKFGDVIARFLAAQPNFIAAFVGLDDRGIPLHCDGSPVVSFCGKASLRLSMDLVAGADLFLGVDSCMRHVADMCSVPSVILTGRDTHGFDCWRCSNITLTSESVADISTESVFYALEALAQKERPK